MIQLVRSLAIPRSVVFWSVDGDDPIPVTPTALREHILKCSVENAEHLAAHIAKVTSRPAPSTGLRWFVHHKTGQAFFHVDTLAVLSSGGGKAQLADTMKALRRPRRPKR